MDWKKRLKRSVAAIIRVAASLNFTSMGISVITPEITAKIDVSERLSMFGVMAFFIGI